MWHSPSRHRSHQCGRARVAAIQGRHFQAERSKESFICSSRNTQHAYLNVTVCDSHGMNMIQTQQNLRHDNIKISISQLLPTHVTNLTHHRFALFKIQSLLFHPFSQRSKLDQIGGEYGYEQQTDNTPDRGAFADSKSGVHQRRHNRVQRCMGAEHCLVTNIQRTSVPSPPSAGSVGGLP